MARPFAESLLRSVANVYERSTPALHRKPLLVAG